MSAQHISFTNTTVHGNLLKGALAALENAIQQLVEIGGSMDLMVDGDNSQAGSFVYMAEKLGAATSTDARNAWLELNSLLSKITTDASVSSVKSAIAQACNKLR